VILVQAGGSGGAVCGPLVNNVYKGIFAQENGVKLPLRPQTEYKGHLNRIEEIEPIDEVPIAADESLGETGEEASEVLPDTPISTNKEQTLPKPTITQETDREGQVIPRATPVSE